MTEEDWRITTSSSLARLEAHFSNLALRYEEMDQRARDAQIAKIIAQQNALCLDSQAQQIADIRADMAAHVEASEEMTSYARQLVEMAKEDAAWRRVRAQLLGAAKWMTGIAAGVLLLYQVAVNAPAAFDAIRDAIDKAFGP